MARASPRELPKSVGRYEVVRQLGIGAMGRVLLARDPVLERHVAIKVLRDDLAIAADVRDALLVRMRHEARAAARVTHPNLVIIHDMGEDEELGLYLVFEYIEGPTLKQRLGEGRLSARQAARIGREIGSALSYAHERGVLHRDVKPENIILSPTGTKLTDFGIARVPDSTLTHVGGLLGTPAYSAPETFREGKFSPESDQFSLAATLYEAIRGARAFPGDDAVSVASRIATEGPEPFAASLKYPEELDAILARGLSKDPAERFESCKVLGNQIVDALLAPSLSTTSRIMAADTTSAEYSMPHHAHSLPPARPSDPPIPKEKRNWQVFAIGLLALLALGLVLRSAMKAPGQTATATPQTVQAALLHTASASAETTTTVSAPPPVKSTRKRPDAPRPTVPPVGPDAPSATTSASVPTSSSAATPSASASASAKATPTASASAKKP